MSINFQQKNHLDLTKVGVYGKIIFMIDRKKDSSVWQQNKKGVPVRENP